MKSIYNCYEKDEIRGIFDITHLPLCRRKVKTF